MTERGGSGSASGGNRPSDDQPSAPGWETGQEAPAAPGPAAKLGLPDASGSPTAPSGGETPRWQPFADAPVSGTPPMGASPSMPADSMTTPAPDMDEGSLVPEQLHDAPAYIPPPMGMTPGGIMPPPDPSEVPTSAWITTAPQTAPPKRGLLSGGIATVVGSVIGIVIVGAVIAGVLGLLPSDKGKILFGTAAGKDLCSVTGQATTVKPTDPVFFTAILKHHMDGAQAITFHIVKDGKDLVNHEEAADGTSFDCYGNRESLGSLEAGSYVFEVIHKGEIEATGNLTVK